MVREIPLTQGYVTLVDDEDYEWLSRHAWCVLKSRCGTMYATTGLWSNKRSHTIRMHRLITNAEPGVEVDHCDGNGLNNQRANLRISTRRENCMNRSLRTDSKSGYKGVTWIPSKNRWQARIVANGARISLGHFTCPLEASHAYDAAARRLYGSFARVNHPVEGEYAA